MSKKWKAKIEERQTKAAVAAAKTMNGQNHIQFWIQRWINKIMKSEEEVRIFVYLYIFD